MIRGIKFVGVPVRNQDASLKFLVLHYSNEIAASADSEWIMRPRIRFTLWRKIPGR